MQRKPKIDLERVGECWEWTGYINPHGYGFRGRTAMHRASYELSKGKVPRGFHVHHKCRNRKCINPEHLRAINGKDHLRQHNDKFYKEFAMVTHPVKLRRQPKAQHLVIATASLPTY